ncbi:hypothetical protein I3842_03G158300 [Carya illinoinensis]|uniref:RNase H type-1 domain-containing protein n=1 Tax=Carya illinoinensis TaxID=32201 RepID=A0A922FKG6_CARIL|nr:hypothetical protein I3842_03G158300 [Carya illinoinensis]
MSSYVKANWDIALDHPYQKMGVGIIIINENGEILVAKSLGTFMAVSLCLELGFNRIVSEGDAKNVVDGHILHEIQILLSSLQNWEFHFVPRDANQLAHNLAKAAISLKDASMFIYDVPVHIQDLVFTSI